MASTSKAQQSKDKGNQAFKSGKFVAAIGHYTDAILVQPSEPTYFLNRAAAYLKLEKNEDAERDCTAALKIQPSNVKALYRRAQARTNLKRWNDAILDFTKVLELDPTNLAAQAELQKAQSSRSSEPGRRTTPLSETPKRRRVPITIVDSPPASSSSSLAAQESIKRRRVPITVVDDQSQSRKDTGPESSGSTTIKHKSILKNSTTTPSNNPTRVTGGVFRTDGTSHIVTTSSPTSSKAIQPDRKDSTQTNVAPPANWNLAAMARFFSIETDPQMRWLAIQYTQPENLPAFFAHSLSSEIVMQCINTFRSLLEGPCSDSLKDRILSYMKSFNATQRFKTIVLFLGSSEKESIRQVWQELGEERVDASLRAAWST